MNKPFSLDHLSDTEFENFCFDLLTEIGFINVSWRKGTGLTTSPADHGRDIEGQVERIDVDGTHLYERWFIECKHYTKGVPPDKLQSALAWASAERPHKLLLIASNFFSNPAKDYLDKYRTTNTPPFEIKLWEKPELEKLALGKSKLLRKYKIGGDFPHLELLHPAHVVYLREFPFSSLDYLFEVFDGLDRVKRDLILKCLSSFFRERRRRSTKSASNNEIIGRFLRMMNETISMTQFRQQCITAVKYVNEPMLVFSIVSYVLVNLFEDAGLSLTDTKIDLAKWDLKMIEEQLKGKTEIPQITYREDFSVIKSQVKVADIISEKREKLKDIRKVSKDNVALYEYFCEEVVAKLLVQRTFTSRY